MASFLSLQEAVKDNLHSGDTVAFEGFTHLIPVAAAHEVIRQGLTDLTLVRMTPDIIYDQMIGLGMARKVICAYLGNPGVGLLRRIRDAVENQWPKSIEIEEYSHACMASAYEAGAAGLPLALLRGYHDRGLAAVNPKIRTLHCPFTGESLVAVPALRPDVTFIHAQQADRRGNVLLHGIVGVQKEAVLAAGRSVVTVEDVVDRLDPAAVPNAVILPGWAVTAVCVVPGGAHPSYAQGHYIRDNAAYLAWDEIARDRDTFLTWIDANVRNSSPQAFPNRITHLLEET